MLSLVKRSVGRHSIKGTGKVRLGLTKRYLLIEKTFYLFQLSKNYLYSLYQITFLISKTSQNIFHPEHSIIISKLLFQPYTGYIERGT